jgi:hypothetical protein
VVDGSVEQFFPGLDLDIFWNDNEYAVEAYVDAPASEALITSIQAEPGYRLPAAYVALVRWHNGGMPYNTSLAGEAGSRFWMDEWGYPAIGIYLADCPSAGHDMVAFDHRDCGPEGEPRVVHVDQEYDDRITVLAPDFVTFVRALRPDVDYDTET